MYCATHVLYRLYQDTLHQTNELRKQITYLQQVERKTERSDIQGAYYLKIQFFSEVARKPF